MLLGSLIYIWFIIMLILLLKNIISSIGIIENKLIENNNIIWNKLPKK
jgi:hypothetical protein